MHTSVKKKEVKTKLLKPLGFDVLANFNFKYNIVALANESGITTRQFADFKAGAKTEVFKRLNALL